MQNRNWLRSEHFSSWRHLDARHRECLRTMKVFGTSVSNFCLGQLGPPGLVASNIICSSRTSPCASSSTGVKLPDYTCGDSDEAHLSKMWLQSTFARRSQTIRSMICSET